VSIFRARAAALGLLAILAGALYLPFLGNPPFYDDRVVFSGHAFADAASSPLALALRQPAYFSLAFVQVLWGSIEAHRLVSLVLHVACAWALYGLIREVQRTHEQTASDAWAALCGTVLFALHPVAVYGAGYLVQRSILLATLFTLLSGILFLRGLRRGGYADALSAAALFSLAVLSKEHAILAPAAIALAGFLYRSRFALRYAGLYLASCAPVALFVFAMARGYFGVRYESEAMEVTERIGELAPAPGWEWAGSATAQAALFFRYLGLWLLPRTGAMSLDLKVDFPQLWAPGTAAAAWLGYLAVGALGAFLVARRGRGAAAGFGLLYVWIMFVVEFATIRVQEPFVLYRSYLWAPGLAVALAALLGGFPVRIVMPAVCAAATLLAVQSHDRLKTFSSGLALWEDAAAKLPQQPVAGAWRTLYNLGREYLYAGQPDKALAVTERCLAQYAETYHCLFARAAIHIQLGEHEAALPFLQRAIAVRPRDGAARHHLGLAYQELGCRDAARAQYRISYDLGFSGARFRLESLDSPGKGLLPPAPSRSRAGFACPS
jgi:tetratricopeptide (TPR) repeat protein